MSTKKNIFSSRLCGNPMESKNAELIDSIILADKNRGKELAGTRSYMTGESTGE